jgi:hypothetical protein
MKAGIASCGEDRKFAFRSPIEQPLQVIKVPLGSLQKHNVGPIARRKQIDSAAN